MRLIIVTLLISFTQGALAAPKTLANFTPGEYVRVSGPADKCHAGRFTWIDQNMIRFGQHPFETRTSATIIKSDIEQEAGCTYDARNNIDVAAGQTRLSYLEVLRCPQNKTRHQLKREAILTNGQVTIQVQQVGNPEFADEESYSYTCTFAPARAG